MSGNQPTSIKVTVTFAAAEKPYQHDFDPNTPISAVLEAVLTAFEITADGTTRYYLLHSGVEVAPTTTLAEIAGHARVVHLSLRTETTQG